MRFLLSRLTKLAPLSLIAALAIAGCGATQPGGGQRPQLVAPAPIPNNSGAFLCPYKADGSLAAWAQQGVGGAVGKTAGQVGTTMATNLGTNLGQAALGQIPGVGGLFGAAAARATGEKVQQAANREVAVMSRGGWDGIKNGSDLSFNTLADLATYMYVKHSADSNYQNALNAVMEVYPEMQSTYPKAIQGGY